MKILRKILVAGDVTLSDRCLYMLAPMVIRAKKDQVLRRIVSAVDDVCALSCWGSERECPMS